MSTTDRDAEISRLTDKLNRLNNRGDGARAARIAERLAPLLGDPTPEGLRRHVHSWTAVYEARGDLYEAARIAEADIDRKRNEIARGDYDAYPDLIPDEVEYLQICLWLQADRHEQLGHRAAARACMTEVFALAERYGVEPDIDMHDLRRNLDDETSE